MKIKNIMRGDVCNMHVIVIKIDFNKYNTVCSKKNTILCIMYKLFYLGRYRIYQKTAKYSFESIRNQLFVLPTKSQYQSLKPSRIIYVDYNSYIRYYFVYHFSTFNENRTERKL